MVEAVVKKGAVRIRTYSSEIADKEFMKKMEALAEYIRPNLNISDVPDFPYNRIKVELIAPRLNEKNVRIITKKNGGYSLSSAVNFDWRRGL